jgi:hypothetical protein
MSHDPCYATLLCNVLVGASYCHWKDIIVRIVRIILKLSIEYMHNILEPTKSSSNGAVTGPWPGSFSGRIFLKRPTGLRPGPGGSRSGRTLGLDRDCLPLFQSPGIASRPRRYPDMATVAHDFHAITSSLASF